jgi:hypothetical protein
MLRSLFLLFLFFPLVVFAREHDAFLSKMPSGCSTRYEALLLDLQKNTGCYSDEDCAQVYFGCPWQGDQCSFFILGSRSEDERKRLVELMAEFDEECVAKTPHFFQHCEQVLQRHHKLGCNPQKLRCVRGECMNFSRLIIDNEME